MKSNKCIKPSVLSLAIASVLSATSFSGLAQEKEEAIEVIEVTGIRSSVIKAMDIKRDSQGVVDAISAEDIGKFPDTNLAESLQRISGVSIDRNNNEGNQITVRGFGPSFNLVTLNGRSMPFADSPKQEGAGGTQNRSFNFEQIAAESVSGVQIYKTARADVASGGIGATVNIETAKPFNFEGFKSAFSVKAINDSSVQKGDDFTPEFSGMISNRFMDGKLGLLAAFSSSERHSSQEIIASDGWLRQTGGNCELGYNTPFSPDCGGAGGSVNTANIDASSNPDGNIWLPQNFNMDISHHERERTNAQLVFQFAPNDKMEFTVDYFMSDYATTIERYQTAHWVGNWVSATADANGTLAHITNGAGGTDFIGYYDEVETENDSIGVNFKWQISDTFSMQFDAHSSESHAQPDGTISENSLLLTNSDFACYAFEVCYAGQYTLDYYAGSDLPVLNDPTSMAAAGYDGQMRWLYTGDVMDGISGPYDPALVGGNLAIGRGNEVKNTIDQYKLDFTWVNEGDSALAAINFGVGYVDFKYDTTWRMHFTGLGRGWNPNPSDLTYVDRGSLGSAFSGSESLFPYTVEFDVNDLLNRVDDEVGFTYNPDVINQLQEETISAYIQFEFETEFHGMPIDIVAGTRYESTDVAGATTQVTPYALRYVSLTELRTQFDAEPQYSTTELTGDYTYFLPNLDVSMEVKEDVIVRFSAGRSLTRNDLTALRPATNIANSRPAGPYLAYQGNPNLKPYVADNLDLSFEWYYQEGSYASIGYFKKWVDNYISNNTTSGKLYNADGVAYTDPSQGDLGAGAGQCPANGTDAPVCDGTVVPNSPDIDWLITTPVNKDSASVDGVEIALQHLFDDSGFGIQANATFVSGDVEYDVTSVEEQTALIGLSDSANFVAFYDKNGFQARIAYNWRDDFLASTDQLRAPDEPVFTEAYGQIDANISYDINENFTVFVEGLNLTEEELRQHGRFENQLVSAQAFGARYNIGVRGKF